MAHDALPAAFFARDPREVAPELLGRLLVRASTTVRIVEVEAYCGADDPASHARNGPTRRNQTMFGPPGRWYVYFTYGMHWCANVVCGPEGEAAAVLVRAARPERGLAVMRRRRPAARTDRDLCRGPARLCQAMGIDGRLDGSSVTGGPLRVVEDGTAQPAEVVCTPRIGVSAGTELPWRWLVNGDPHVSHATWPRR